MRNDDIVFLPDGDRRALIIKRCATRAPPQKGRLFVEEHENRPNLQKQVFSTSCGRCRNPSEVYGTIARDWTQKEKT